MPIIDRLRHGVDCTKWKADQLLRINNVQSEIGNLRRQIQELREKIASGVIAVHKQDAVSYPEIEELCVAIDKIEIQISEKEAHVAAIRAESPPQLAQVPASIGPSITCPSCHFNVPVNAVFCPNCGKQIPQPSEAINSASSADPSACVKCGASLPVGAAYCPNCQNPVASSG